MYFNDHKDDNLIRCKKCNRMAVDCMQDERDKFIVIHPKDGSDKYWLCGTCNRAREVFSDEKTNPDLQMIITPERVYTKGEYVG